MHKVTLSPSSQEDNMYATGNVTEAYVCGEIAKKVNSALIRCGIDVLTVHKATLANKCKLSDEYNSELHVPIHTNAFNKKVSGTRIFCYSIGGDGYKASQAIAKYLFPLSIGTSDNISANPSLYEVKNVKAPTAYIEVDFHDVPATSDWIQSHIGEIGETIAHGICDYFAVKYVAEEKNKSGTLYKVQVGAFSKKENAENLKKELKAKGYNAFIVEVG